LLIRSSASGGAGVDIQLFSTFSPVGGRRGFYKRYYTHLKKPVKGRVRLGRTSWKMRFISSHV